MEEWHQKLHNNTTPDDVPICSAYIKFLEVSMSLQGTCGRCAYKLHYVIHCIRREVPTPGARKCSQSKHLDSMQKWMFCTVCPEALLLLVCTVICRSLSSLLRMPCVCVWGGVRLYAVIPCLLVLGPVDPIVTCSVLHCAPTSAAHSFGTCWGQSMYEELGISQSRNITWSNACWLLKDRPSLLCLQANGDRNAYWRVLSDAGITRQRLESFDRAIKCEPEWFGSGKKDTLIKEFRNYLGILKAVHSG